ncbi:MAG: biopolymer transporter ExbD [Candidatus Aminicenantes bacterium]|nr:biopolymer transporter ExbD [Candidatus Aminicenantes bacterium]
MFQSAEPNVVPLCDVLLVLLIIFMVITPSLQKGIDVKLPDTTDAGGPTASVIVMTLHKNMKVDINHEYHEWELLPDELERIYAPRQEKVIFIRAEARVPFVRVLELMDIAKGAGVEVLGIIPEYFEETEEIKTN